MHIVLGVLKKVQVNFSEIICNIFSLNCFYNHLFSQNRARRELNKLILFDLWWSSVLIGEGIFESFHTWLKALYNCHNWPSRWFPTLIMRISHLIQTIHPDLQILTSVLEGDSFSKKKKTTTKKKTPEQSLYNFIFHWLVWQWSSWQWVLTNEKCPENNYIESQLGLNSLRPLPACAILLVLSIMNWVVIV